MKLCEKVFISLAILGYILRGLGKDGNVFITLSVMGLALMYSCLGFALFHNIQLRNLLKAESYKGLKATAIVKAILSGVAISVTLIGIVFSTFHWPGAATELMTGISIIIPVITVAAVRYRQTKSGLSLNILLRAVPVLLVACIFAVRYFTTGH